MQPFVDETSLKVVLWELIIRQLSAHIEPNNYLIWYYFKRSCLQLHTDSWSIWVPWAWERASWKYMLSDRALHFTILLLFMIFYWTKLLNQIITLYIVMFWTLFFIIVINVLLVNLRVMCVGMSYMVNRETSPLSTLVTKKTPIDRLCWRWIDLQWRSPFTSGNPWWIPLSPLATDNARF